RTDCMASHKSCQRSSEWVQMTTEIEHLVFCIIPPLQPLTKRFPRPGPHSVAELAPASAIEQSIERRLAGVRSHDISAQRESIIVRRAGRVAHGASGSIA